MNLDIHCILAGASSSAVAAITSTTIEDLALRGAFSVVVGVITWCITQMISKKLKNIGK